MAPAIWPACASRASSTSGWPASAAAPACATGGAGAATATRRKEGIAMTRWIGPAAWSRRESRAGARLPYARHADGQTLLLRDGALMRILHVSGLAFETEDAEQLDHMLGV